MSTRLQAKVNSPSTPAPSFTPARAGVLQRKWPFDKAASLAAERDEGRQKRFVLQRRAIEAEPAMVPPIVHEVLRSPGQPPDPDTRAFMEPRFGHDFSQVRVHKESKAGDVSSSTPSTSFTLPSEVLTDLPTGLQPAARQARLHDDHFAHQAAHALDLEAFTIANHVFFGHGYWQSDSAKGSALLQHELGHMSRREGQSGTIEGWSSAGHRTITRQALENDSRYSEAAKMLLANTAPVPDYNRPQILQDMVSFWAGERLYRAPLGLIGGALIGGITPPEQGTQIGGARVSGVLPQAILGTGLIPTVPAAERVRGGRERPELQGSRVTQELANHGEDLPARNEARMNGYTDQGVAAANRCDMYNGLVQLGYALHVAQDRGSHGDGYTAEYVQNRPHSQIDDMTSNPDGLAVAISNSQRAIDRFFNGLTEAKKRSLADPLTLQLTQPPVIETILAPPAATSGPPFAIPEAGPQPSGGINLLTVRF